MTATTVPTLELNDGHRIDGLGFGVFLVPAGQTVEAVTEAVRTGYRLIDTAAAYGNEAEVGEAVARSELPREDLFVTTKLWNDSQGRDRTRRAFEDSLECLGLEYVDLYLIHWPAPAQDLYVETWEALVELRADGRARSIGVSNFLASISTGSSTQPGSSRRSTRSSCTRCSSRPSCAGTTPSTGSSPRRGARSPRGSFSTTR